ncbi:MAG TPA: glycosyltransferase [Bacteroidales bacterium]|nr:glycosyltransferase [Bacteroidales bacterium]
MRILINCSNIRVGGASQVALATLHHLQSHPEHDYTVVLSPYFHDQVDMADFPPNFAFHVLDRSIANPRHFLQVKRTLETLEKNVRPDCTFTVFGPSYWTPRSPHLMGYAIPHYVYPESPYFDLLSRKEKWFFRIKRAIHRYFIKRNAKYFHVETQDVKSRLSRLFAISPDAVYVVSNALHPVFRNPEIRQKELALVPRHPNEVRLICISGFHPHKNLTIIRQIIPLLKKKFDFPVRFILTIPEDRFAAVFSGFEDSIINAGPVSIESAPSLYSQADILFFPTLLECFSALYLEAMYLGKPILTSDLSFAHDLCGEAACYFDPLSPESMVQSISQVLADDSLREAMIAAGRRRITDFPTGMERTDRYLSILTSICKAS